MNLPESEYKLKLKNHIVSFIDILGATNSIISESEKSLNLVHIAYEKAIETFNSLFKDKSITPTVKIFSDNILVSLPYNDKLKRPAFLAVAMISAIIQVQFLSFGYLTRGAISYGSFYCDNLMVWGQALVNAYRLESNNAIYPRVIVDPNLIDYLDIIKKGNDSKVKWNLPMNRSLKILIIFQFAKNGYGTAIT